MQSAPPGPVWYEADALASSVTLPVLLLLAIWKLAAPSAATPDGILKLVQTEYNRKA
ncbi:MAG: hypothetical protein ACYCSS_11210 [Sulfuriferula sp.]